MTVVEQLARHIAARLNLPFEGTAAGSVFFGYMPEWPVRAVCVYALDVRPAGDPRGDSVQICVRSDMDGEWPLMISEKILATLNDMDDRALTPEGSAPIRVRISSGISFNGLVSNNTQIYTMQASIYTCGEESICPI